MRIGVFGGTYDPVHAGHVAVAAAVHRGMGLDAVRVVPCHRPPHKARPDLTPGADRLAMIALATQDTPALVPSSYELTRPAPSYTIDTLRGMQAAEPAARLYFIMGMDSFNELALWKEHGSLLADFHLVVVNRPGSSPPAAGSLPAGARVVAGADDRDTAAGRVHMLTVPPQAASSTEIRRRAGQGEDLGGMVPPPVASYIHRCAVYR
jgi:nicotinate-nucleotide adenylyltransferase